ncbi:MAG: hypothetical protein ACREU6_11290 [Steroidobacteraceae bacterium]
MATISVSAANFGNDAAGPDLALLAAENIVRRYPVNPRRPDSCM